MYINSINIFFYNYTFGFWWIVQTKIPVLVSVPFLFEGSGSRNRYNSVRFKIFYDRFFFFYYFDIIVRILLSFWDRLRYFSDSKKNQLRTTSARQYLYSNFSFLVNVRHVCIHHNDVIRRCTLFSAGLTTA